MALHQGTVFTKILFASAPALAEEAISAARGKRVRIEIDRLIAV
jgi:hypothetical protein